MITAADRICSSWCTDHQKPGHPEDERHLTRVDMDGVYGGYEITEYVINGNGPELHFWGDGDDPAVAEEMAEFIADGLARFRSIRGETSTAAEQFDAAIEQAQRLYWLMDADERAQTDRALGVVWRTLREASKLSEIEEGDLVEVQQGGVTHLLKIGTVNGLDLLPADDNSYETVTVSSSTPVEIWRLAEVSA